MQKILMKDPHKLLGLHELPEGKVIRLWRPEATEAALEVKGKVCQAKAVDTAGLFELMVDSSIGATDYRITHPSGLEAHDPYSFLPTFSNEDERLFSLGKHEKIAEVMGGRLTIHYGIAGVKFAVWAPCAQAVSLVGDFNHWNPHLHPMRLMGASGVWELFVPGLKEGEKYKFYILTSEGHGLFKADPYALQGEMRPNTASVVTRSEEHVWQDHKWLERRTSDAPLKQPLNIYEIHMGSWKMQGFEFMNYRTVAPHLANYCKEMGYTHVEFMPIMGHPLDESWGYQVTGFYAISSRYGTIADFQYLVDYLHQNDIGVIFDWVPGHFPTDLHSIVQFDGTHLYEHQDPRQGYHPHWNTHIFNYGRFEVINFLIGSALYYLEKMHIDGLRVDAVSSMVYLDYGRKKGEWIPNEKGGNENLEAIAFLQELNTQVQKKFPGVLMIAEESHAFPGVTKPVSEGGLGFHLKWGLGWMNDTLRFFQTGFDYRDHRKNLLTHEFTYYFDEQYLLPLSHDEVVHEKKSLLSKMPGNEWEKFANLRLLLSYMICHPGKKLLFMGGEFGLWKEWNCKEELPWHLIELPMHQKLKCCVRDLNHFYRHHSALWEEDFSKEGFEWVDTEMTFSYFRHAKNETLLCVHNLTSRRLENVAIPCKNFMPIEIFNTDSQEYGGYGILNPNISNACLNLAPFATSILCQKKST